MKKPKTKRASTQASPAEDLLSFLPNEIVEHILLFLGFEASNKINSTCKRLYNIINGPNFIKQGMSQLTQEKMLAACHTTPNFAKTIFQDNTFSKNLTDPQIANLILNTPDLFDQLMQNPNTASFLLQFANRNMKILQKMRDYPDTWEALDDNNLFALASKYTDITNTIMAQHPEKIASQNAGNLLILLKKISHEPLAFEQAALQFLNTPILLEKVRVLPEFFSLLCGKHKTVDAQLIEKNNILRNLLPTDIKTLAEKNPDFFMDMLLDANRSKKQKKYIGISSKITIKHKVKIALQNPKSIKTLLKTKHHQNALLRNPELLSESGKTYPVLVSQMLQEVVLQEGLTLLENLHPSTLTKLANHVPDNLLQNIITPEKIILLTNENSLTSLSELGEKHPGLIIENLPWIIESLRTKNIHLDVDTINTCFFSSIAKLCSIHPEIAYNIVTNGTLPPFPPEELVNVLKSLLPKDFDHLISKELLKTFNQNELTTIMQARLQKIDRLITFDNDTAIMLSVLFHNMGIEEQALFSQIYDDTTQLIKIQKTLLQNHTPLPLTDEQIQLPPKNLVEACKSNPHLATTIICQDHGFSANLTFSQTIEIIPSSDLFGLLMKDQEIIPFLAKHASQNSLLLEKMKDYPEIWWTLPDPLFLSLCKLHPDLTEQMIEAHPEKFVSQEPFKLTELLSHLKESAVLKLLNSPGFFEKTGAIFFANLYNKISSKAIDAKIIKTPTILKRLYPSTLTTLVKNNPKFFLKILQGHHPGLSSKITKEDRVKLAKKSSSATKCLLQKDNHQKMLLNNPPLLANLGKHHKSLVTQMLTKKHQEAPKSLENFSEEGLISLVDYLPVSTFQTTMTTEKLSKLDTYDLCIIGKKYPQLIMDHLHSKEIEHLEPYMISFALKKLCTSHPKIAYDIMSNVSFSRRISSKDFIKALHTLSLEDFDRLVTIDYLKSLSKEQFSAVKKEGFKKIDHLIYLLELHLTMLSKLHENQTPEPNKLYIQLTNGVLQYKLLLLNGKIIQGSISNNNPDIGTFLIPDTLDLDNPNFKQGILKLISNRNHTPLLGLSKAAKGYKAPNNFERIAQDVAQWAKNQELFFFNDSSQESTIEERPEPMELCLENENAPPPILHQKRLHESTTEEAHEPETESPNQKRCRYT